MSSEHLVIVCHNRRTGQLLTDPNMTLYDMEGARQVLATTKMIYNRRPDADDWWINIYHMHWDPVKGIDSPKRIET